MEFLASLLNAEKWKTPGFWVLAIMLSISYFDLKGDLKSMAKDIAHINLSVSNHIINDHVNGTNREIEKQTDRLDSLYELLFSSKEQQ